MNEPFLFSFDEINKLGITDKDSALNLLLIAASNAYDYFTQTIDTDDLDLIEIEEIIYDMDFDTRMNERQREGYDLTPLLESEYVRVFNATQQKLAEKVGGNITKRWCTVGDLRVRDTHSYLDGSELRYTDEFISYDGDSALYPHGFTNASNNVNCRCWLEYRLREEDKTRTVREDNKTQEY